MISKNAPVSFVNEIPTGLLLGQDESGHVIVAVPTFFPLLVLHCPAPAYTSAFVTVVPELIGPTDQPHLSIPKFSSVKHLSPFTQAVSEHNAGVLLGKALGAALGFELGAALGMALGVALGIALGCTLGMALGAALGIALGAALGDALGKALGDELGVALGLALGIGLTHFGSVDGVVKYQRQDLSTLPPGLQRSYTPR
jgi:hypothetical protein